LIPAQIVLVAYLPLLQSGRPSSMLGEPPGFLRAVQTQISPVRHQTSPDPIRSERVYPRRMIS
jgi:hypothetical protein